MAERGARRGGESAAFSGADGALSEAENQLLLAWTALESGERALDLPAGFTRAAQILCQQRGAQARFANVERARWMDELARKAHGQFLLHFDGLYFALRALAALTNAGLTLSAWRETMPRMHRVSRVVEMTPRRARPRPARAFRKRTRRRTGRRHPPQSRARLGLDQPGRKRPLCHIVSESADAEFADELCALCEKALKEHVEPRRPADAPGAVCEPRA